MARVLCTDVFTDEFTGAFSDVFTDVFTGVYTDVFIDVFTRGFQLNLFPSKVKVLYSIVVVCVFKDGMFTF